MNLFTNPLDINIGDSLIFEYDNGKISKGICTDLPDELIEVNFTTEQSKKVQIEKFRKGVWKKEML